MAAPASPQDPRFVAIVDMVRRTGSSQFELRCSEGNPEVWVAIAKHNIGADGRPGREGRESFEAGAALHPYQAVYRLAETLIDGGTCRHCRRPTGIVDDIDPMPLPEQVCWWQWDPELAVFRRGCEGQT